MLHTHSGRSLDRAIRRWRLSGLALVLAAATGCSDGPLEAFSDAEVPPEHREFVSILNGYRKGAGCRELRWHQPTAGVAQRHSDDMVQRQFFGHVDPDGRSLAHRLAEGGVSYRIAGENLAAGQPTAAEVLQDWMASSAHRRNIENCAFTHHGLGRRDHHWTHVLLTPR